MTNIIEFYHKARLFVIEKGFSDEIKWCRERRFINIDKKEFAFEYTFAVLASSGLREQVVRKNYNKFLNALGNGDAFDTIKNRRQKAALLYVWSHLDEIFKTLKTKITDEEKIEYLDTLPQIGPKAKYHLARNLGIDCVKPDRHMERLAVNFRYKSPLAMCEDIRRQLIEPERVGVIDVILWRYCNLTGEFE